MSHDYTHSLNPAPARQHPPLRRRLPTPAYEPPPKYSEFLQRMLVRARESLGEEFRGITADGMVRPGLFPVRKTGVSLEPILRRCCRKSSVARKSRAARQETVYKAGEYYFETGNLAHTARNKTNLPLRVLAVEIIPKDWTAPAMIAPKSQ